MMRRTIILCLAAAVMGGCAAPVQIFQNDSAQNKPREADRAAGQKPIFSDAKPNGYVLVRPEDLGVTSAADMSGNTYIGFSAPPVAGLRVFNGEGQKLEHITHGRVLGVPGVHQGILLRNEGKNTFLAKDTTARLSEPLIDYNHDADFVAVRAGLAESAANMATLREAIRKADASLAPQPVTVDQNTPDPLPSSEAESSDTYQVLPSGDVLVRVFFAFGGQAIVRPDDGLLRLELEAKRAGAIRLTGYTDSSGPKALNDELARKRAEGIARFLVSRGVRDSKISIASVGAGDYLASNSTAKGRASNRRVEAHFYQPVALR